MKNKWWIAAVVVIAVAAAFGAGKLKSKKGSDEQVKIIQARIGNIATVVSTTGTVLPKNRLEVKPPVNGRVEEVLVKEGEHVKAGQVMAWMSSTDRAALLDAARGQNGDTINYWKQVYKPIPLIAPIDGQVIVGTTQPGQTVTVSDPVMVLSDRLIVRAQVDETDIGKIKEGLNASISLDAYPENKIKAGVDHIYYESKTVNNVTVYAVDLLPQEVPAFFRSGMNANIDFTVQNKENILVLPIAAVNKGRDGATVLIQGERGKPQERAVVIGISDDKNIEIVSGLSQEDDVVLKSKRYSIPQQSSGSNPFMPSRRGGGRS